MPVSTESRLFIDHLETPLGRFAIVADEQGRLRAAGFTDGHPRMQRHIQARERISVLTPKRNPSGLTDSLQRYFAGDVHAIDAIDVHADGTAFQQSVWRTLREIPCGAAWSYAEMARRIGRPKAVRAVGLANGANPIGIVVPCHRVVASHGGLGGYGGGVERKQWLLTHEGWSP